MGKIVVYIREYPKEKDQEYYDIIKQIKENCFDASNEEKRYFTFDGKLFVKISPSLATSNYHQIKDARIRIEKVGPNREIESKIEKLLLKKGFKRENL